MQVIKIDETTVEVDGKRFVLSPAPPRPEPPVATWGDVQEGAWVESNNCVIEVLRAGNVDFAGWNHTDGNTWAGTKYCVDNGDYRLLRAAPPMTERLRIRDKVRLADGTVGYVRSIYGDSREDVLCSDAELTTGWRCVNQYDPEGAEIVREVPEGVR